MALACQFPLREFLSKVQSHETTMGPFATRSIRGIGNKAKWAVFMADDVKRIRAVISAKVITINLLLATHASETLSRMEHEVGSIQKELFQNLNEQRAYMETLCRGMHDTKGDVIMSHDAIRKEVFSSSSRLERKLDSISSCMERKVQRRHKEALGKFDRLSQAVEDMKEGVTISQKEVGREASSSASKLESRLESIACDTVNITQHLSSLSIGLASAQTSLVSLRGLGSQIMAFLRTFPAELRDLLQNIACANMQMYLTLLHIQDKVAASPTLLLQSNIRFEDAFGVVRDLPYEWFHYWEVSILVLLLFHN